MTKEMKIVEMIEKLILDSRNENRELFQGIDAKIDGLADCVNTRFDSVDQKFNWLDKKLDRIDKKHDINAMALHDLLNSAKVELKDELGSKIDQVGAKLDEHMKQPVKQFNPF